MIKITNISKTFSGNQVLNDISLEIEEGDVVALIGASGAGKSTFLRALNDLERPDSGQIEIDDLKVDYSTITKQEVLELRRMEGLIQVKKLSKAQAKEIAEAELDKVGLTDRKDYYPKFLSGGQKQRVGIARALAMQPKLLLLDEPTSALDPELVGEVQEVILNAAQNKQTMVLVSHEMDFVYNVATNVLFLEQGKIIEAGTPQEVFYSPKNPRTREFLSRHVKNLEVNN